MALCDYDKTIENTPLSPEDHIPLMEVKYHPTILKDRFAQFAGLNFFNPEVTVVSRDLQISHSLIVRFENTENPFNMVNVSDVTYKQGQSCPPVMDMPCTEGCISTVPTWRQKEIRFDKLYRVGASWCVETEKLTYGTLEERFRKSVEANTHIQGILAWNAFMCQALEAAQATQTMIPTDRACFATHYYDAGSAIANGYEALSQAINYMKVVYGGLTEYGILAHRYFESDMVAPGATIYTGFGAASSANANAGATTVNVPLVQGGWKAMGPLGGKLFGETVYIAPDDIFFYNPTINTATGAITNGSAVNSFNPFLSADGKKYYVVIASRRSFLTGVEPLMDMTHFPATCDNKYESIQESFLGYNDLLFPREVFILAFDVACDGGDSGAASE